MPNILGYALRFLLILPAIVMHEVAHGFVANMLGDPTAKRAGRLTLNPVKHIDPFGTLLLPAMLLLASGGSMAFGYAKPVPVNPGFFRNYRTGFFLTAIAGPGTNLLLAAIAALFVRLLGGEGLAAYIFYSFGLMNLVLMFFNLIPIPPLDGSRVIPLFLSDSAMRTYAQAERYGFGILLLLLWGFPALFGVDPLGAYLEWTVVPLLNLLTGV